MLILISIILFSTLPYATFTQNTVFTVSIDKSTELSAEELLLSRIVTNLSSIKFSCPFFPSPSSVFSEQAKLICFCRKSTLFRPNQQWIVDKLYRSCQVGARVTNIFGSNNASGASAIASTRNLNVNQ
ncbi:unnamed protein product [Rotaria magnacalcarata]|uniref:Uncharacterized protein n=1 Tax=Rotaria magnacalcarata TaxID=392030 RepID=A0A818Y5R7_9BILA|nr:unnamed protein product [Rotaria magnacalcarata]CAF2108561.1 unnamed protein product [Rotaria magnacalcarata]CAF3749994.1 unnamed protein product [Rotaria magnacalcarata]CAF3975668.1 unnamed protein product [Rotaria magnacalcarata]